MTWAKELLAQITAKFPLVGTARHNLFISNGELVLTILLTDDGKGTWWDVRFEESDMNVPVDQLVNAIEADINRWRAEAAKRCKIIDTDNFGGDYPDEQVYASNIPNEQTAQVMCDALNAKYSGPTANRIYKVVPMSYELKPGFKP